MNEETRKQLEQKMANLTKRLAELKPGSWTSDERPDGTLDVRYEQDREFEDTLKSIERINDMLHEDDKFNGDTLDKNRRFDLEEEKATTDRIVAKSKDKEIKSKYILTGIQFGGTAALVALAAVLESTRILPRNPLDFIKTLFKVKV